MALAVMVSLLAVPVAAAVGTAVHDSRRDVYAQQHHTRHLVTATITDDTAAQNISRTNTATMAARWSAAGAEHTGAVTAQSATEPGDQVAIWVDDSGALTDEPTPTTRAGVDAVTAALFMWAGVTAAAAILLAGTRAVGDRIRASRWQHAIDTLVGRDGAQTQPALNRRQSLSSPIIHEYGRTPMSAPPLSFETTQARRWTIAHPRLRLKPAHRSAGVVQGGWWPLTDQLYIELRLLLAALSSRSGTIERVIYDENSWASASLRMEFRGHSVILEPSNTSPNTLTVSGKKFGTLVLLVVPPNTNPTAAHAAVMTAADPDDVSSAEDLLAIGMRAAHDGRPA